MLFSPYYAKDYAGIIDKGLLGGPTTHSTRPPPLDSIRDITAVEKNYPDLINQGHSNT